MNDLYPTTTKKNILSSLFMLPKSPGLNRYRLEVFHHGATRRGAFETMLLSGVLFIDHSRRYWTANNGNGARLLPVSPFHIAPTHYQYRYRLPICSSPHRRRWTRPPPAASYDLQYHHHHPFSYHCERKKFDFEFKLCLKGSAAQLPESSCHLLVGYYSPKLRHGTRCQPRASDCCIVSCLLLQQQ